MIERYTLPEMGRVWSEAHKYELWCRVEVLVLEAHARAGTVPAESVEPVRSASPPSPEAVAAVEAVTDHDVIAFLTAWADNTTPRSAAAYVHYGMTSSDLLDTALAVQLAEATDLLAAKATRLVAVLRDHALAHRDTLRAGRTHGIHAEPDTWGHRVADFAFAMARCRDRIVRAREAVAVGTLSGPVGSYSNIDPAIEAEVMPALGLRAADVATQVVMRDGIAEWVGALALAATVCEAVALEVRHGQRTEVGELAEPFRSGQKGSSAMPHKKNPIRSERIGGLARVVRGYVTPVTEGIPLWHERDISHSSVERVALPDAAIATDYLLHLTTGLVSGLTVDAARMRSNLDITGGLMYSSAVLLELVSAGMSREDAYALVQAAALQTWDAGTPFRDTLRKQAATRGVSLPETALDSAFGPERYVARLGPVFVQGAKNAALKIIAASLLTGNGHTVLRNVPPIEDVRRAVELAEAVGAVVEFHEAERTLVVDASNLTSPVLPAEIARRFRSSVLFVPALLHRFGEAVIEGVGGCNLGNRNLDFHYRGFARLGAVVDEGDSTIRIKASKLQGAHLYLDTPSHTGTENLIMAASLAPGKTVIDNTAQEPEVLDVIAFLTKMGARITGGGTGFITVHGVEELTAVEHTVMADRIDAGVFAMAAAITGGQLNLVGASLDHFGVVRWKLEQMGVEFGTNGAVVSVRMDRPVRPINVITSPYPGFATDLQSPIMALACLAEGVSYIRETIFDGRYTLVGELVKMGASVELDRGAVVVHGPCAFTGAEVVAHDLRTGIALVLAGLAAEGETLVTPCYPIDRGHANIAQRFNALGADITAVTI